MSDQQPLQRQFLCEPMPKFRHSRDPSSIVSNSKLRNSVAPGKNRNCFRRLDGYSRRDRKGGLGARTRTPITLISSAQRARYWAEGRRAFFRTAIKLLPIEFYHSSGSEAGSGDSKSSGSSLAFISLSSLFPNFRGLRNRPVNGSTIQKSAFS